MKKHSKKNQTKPGILQITILKIVDVDFFNYKPSKKCGLKSIRKIIQYYEKTVGIKGQIKNNYVRLQTNNGYDYYTYFFDDYVKKYDLTVAINHSYNNNMDHHDVN